MKKNIAVNAGIERAFAVFNGEFDTWWPRSHPIGKSTMKRAYRREWSLLGPLLQGHDVNHVAGAGGGPGDGGEERVVGNAGVLRMAMTVDGPESPGVYGGNQGGQVLASRDGGDHWRVLSNWVPPIYSLETAVS